MASLRQLLVISSLVIACMLLGMMAVGTQMMERQLDGQLQTDGENAVSTLALLVSVQPDAKARLAVLAAAFQQGRFRTLTLRAADGTPEFHETRQATGATDAPGWFSALTPIDPHRAVRRIPSVGELALVLDAAPARDTLWAHFVQWAWLALGILAFWALFVASLMARIRRVLVQISAAPEIHATSDPGDEDAELIDDVRERVAPSVDEQRARIEVLEAELNRDPVTALANRPYFLNELKRRLRDDTRQGAVSGYVFLARARDMGRLQDQSERAELDDWLRLLGRRMTETLADYPQAQALPARLNGADFVVLFPVGGGPEVMRPVQHLQTLFAELRVKLDSHHLSRWAFALTDYTAQCSAKEVLTRLDQALMCAESAGHEEIEFLSYADRDDDELRMGEASWRALITRALDHDSVRLEAHLAQYEGDDIPERYEASLSIDEPDAGQPPMSAFLFMPPATRLGLAPACDLRALSLALSWVGERPQAMLVIRMSTASILDPHFIDGVRDLCRLADAALLGRLVVELNAYGLSRHLEIFRQFAQDLIQAGMQVGLRGLDQQPDALRRIHEVDFAYVKLGGPFMRDLLSSPGGVQMMVAVTETAIGMGMRVYVDDADDAATRRMVVEYGALPRAIAPA